ncbi:MAG: hypothetical protein QOJ26_1869 [Thermoplasmata archaeon]|jgi:hypothetical protein|nr:hypothetical protein [Thermoplasmata archaeon]MEA3166985.1 hypothetical protein [Thermoplasmata archaeon]
MRVRFNDVFSVNGDGSISPKVPVVVGGVQLNPGMDFGRRVRLGTVHFAGVAGRDLEVEQQAGILYLVRPYVPPTRESRVAPPPMVSVMATEFMPIEATP